MPYKRFSEIVYTFAVTHFESVFRKPEFFNSHAIFHQLTGSFRVADYARSISTLRVGSC